MTGRYVLGQRISEGATTTVWRAHDTVLAREVVLKVLRPGSPPAAEATLLAAARLTASVRHPLVPTALEAWPGDATRPARVVMVLVDGESVAELVTREGPLPQGRAVTVLDDVLAALGACHAAGVVHGDLAPGNVVLDPEGRAHLVDLSGSGPHRHGDRVVGTPGFIPPERWAGLPDSPASDLYAFGCLLVHVLTGASPFAGADDAETAAHQAVRSAPSLAAAHSGVAPDLLALAQRCLAREPGERPADVPAVRAALAAARGLTSAAVPERDSLSSVVAPSEPGRTREITVGGHSRPRTPRPAAARATSRSWPGRGVAAAALVAGFVGGAAVRGMAEPATPATASPQQSITRTLHVPAVRGATVDRALSLLGAATVGVAGRRSIADRTVPTGLVVGTDPAAGQPLTTGRVVLLVSAGPPAVVVPDLGGLDLAAARERLERAGLRMGILSRQDGPQPLDTVLSTRPGPDADLARDGAVDLVLASGATAVPSVLGLPRDEAFAAVRAAGLLVSERTVTGVSDRPATVTAVGAPAGTRAQVGSRLTVTVELPAARSRMPDPSPNVSPSDALPTPASP